MATLIIDIIPRDLLLVHHITRIVKSLEKSNKKSETLVALSGAGTTTSTWLDHLEEVFDAKHVVEVEMPSATPFETFENNT